MELDTKRKTERLVISDDPEDGVTILYVPYLPDHGHEHIELTDQALVQLNDFAGHAMARRGLVPAVLHNFFKEIERGDPAHRRWLAEKFKEFWGVEVKPSFDGDIPE